MVPLFAFPGGDYGAGIATPPDASVGGFAITGQMVIAKESRHFGRNVTALNPYGVDIRYPADFPEMTLEDSKEALVLAAKVRDAVRSALKEFLEKGSS